MGAVCERRDLGGQAALSESKLCDLIWGPPTAEKGRTDDGQNKPQTAEIKDHADQRWRENVLAWPQSP